MAQTLPVVNENTSARLRIRFLDWDDVDQAPASASYRVDDVESGTEIRGDTAIASPTSPYDITLIGTSDNPILNDDNSFERRRVTITGDYGGGDEVNGHFDYLVRNLSKIP